MTFWEVVAITSVFLGAVWICYPTHWHRSYHNRDRAYCQQNLKQIALAMKQYRGDNDDNHPSLETVSGWREAVRPYLKNSSIFHCPRVTEPRETSGDYWFNARLSGVGGNILHAQALTVMLGDGYPSDDPRAALSELPKSWLGDENSPARRHLDGLNLAFADGHVKWLRPEKVTTRPVEASGTTFALN